MTVLLMAVALRGKAQSIQSALDPVCRLPRVTLATELAEDSQWILKSGDDLTDPDSWPEVLRVNPDGHRHDWFDPAARAAQRRFYRLERAPRPPLAPMPNFRLTDHRGHSHELFREGDARLVALVFTDNADVRSAWDALAPVRERFAAGPVRFWLVNPRDDRESLATAAAGLPSDVPVLHDAEGLVARTFRAERSGEVVLLDFLDAAEVYRGPVADRCPTPDGGEVVQDYLTQAIERRLDGRSLVWERVRSGGTPLGIVPEPVLSYSTEIGPLLKRRCAECHKPGGIGTWTMDGLAAVRERRVSIRENLLEGLMPPWHADPAHQEFANDFGLTDAERARLVAWLDAGAPDDGGADPLAVVDPPPPEWPLGTPDRILSIPLQSIPATGEVDYQYLAVPNPFATDVWLRAAAVSPGDPTVVHHCLVFYARTLQDLLQVQGGLGGFFAGYVPGMEQVAYPEGTGKRLPAGGWFVFQMHYTPSGRATTDRTRMGLYVQAGVPDRELVTGAAYTTDIQIPPGSRGYQRAAERSFPRGSWLYEMSPHMHYRGDWMRFEALYPDGSREILLNVPKYDFAWQALYRLKDPKWLPAGTRVRVSGGFDNSPWNPFNPNPGASVRFGEQTDDEMFIGYLNYAEGQ